MKIEYSNPWFKVVKNGQHHFLKEEGSNNGAVVLLLLEGRFSFVKIDRPAHQEELIEAPRGYGGNGEASESCAVREVREETGYIFNESDLQYLGKVRPNSAVLSSVIPVYLIECSVEPQRVETDNEVSGMEYIPKEDIYNVIASGAISDGITLSAMALYFSRNHNKKSQSDA